MVQDTIVARSGKCSFTVENSMGFLLVINWKYR